MILAPLMKYVTGGLLFLVIILGLALHVERRHSAKLAQRNSELVAKLDEISSRRNEQKVETQERIKTVTKVIREADKRAEVVEKAPLPGNCQTPSEVLHADI